MKIQDLFDLINAAEDFISFWNGVDGVDQMVSRLERLKREDPKGMVDDLNALRIAVDAALTANIELGGALSGDGEPTLDTDDLLAGLDLPDVGVEDHQNAPGEQSPPTEIPPKKILPPDVPCATIYGRRQPWDWHSRSETLTRTPSRDLALGPRVCASNPAPDATPTSPDTAAGPPAPPAEAQGKSPRPSRARSPRLTTSRAEAAQAREAREETSRVTWITTATTRSRISSTRSSPDGQVSLP